MSTASPSPSSSTRRPVVCTHPARLVAAIDERLEVLRVRARDVPERHRSVRAAIAVSVDLLDEAAARFHRRLGVFGGPFDVALAHARRGYGGDELDTVDLLGDLVDRSLLVAEAHGANDPLLDAQPRAGRCGRSPPSGRRVGRCGSH